MQTHRSLLFVIRYNEKKSEMIKSLCLCVANGCFKSDQTICHHSSQLRPKPSASVTAIREVSSEDKKNFRYEQ